MLAKIYMNDLSNIPIIKHALFFLQEAGRANGIKITETGSLGRNFVQALWDKYLKTSEEDLVFRPTRELECPEVTRLHFLLSESRYVRKFKGKICLTAKGKVALGSKFFNGLYCDMLNAAIHGWNWGYEDRYPDNQFIQLSAEVMINRLHEWPSKTVTANEIFVDVFQDKFSHLNGEQKEDLCHCLNVRFFHRFCVPFGILKDDQDRFLDKNSHDPFEKTIFFKSHFMNVINNQPDGVLFR